MNFRIFLNIFLILSFLALYTQNDVTRFYGEEFNINIESGKTTMEPGFILENGQASVAFYTDIDFLF
ncbi:MAG: hypothetical protein ACJ0PK_06090 [Flavobacteriaceae bacterium]